MYRIYKYRVDENKEIISCCGSRSFDNFDSAMRHFNHCKNADLINCETGEEIKKRG